MQKGKKMPTFQEKFKLNIPKARYTPLNIVQPEAKPQYAALIKALKEHPMRPSNLQMYKRYLKHKQEIQKKGDQFILSKLTLKKHYIPEIGFGVFAKKSFKKGEILGLYAGLIKYYPTGEVEEHDTSHYIFNLFEDEEHPLLNKWGVDGADVRNLMGMINDPHHEPSVNVTAYHFVDEAGHPDVVYTAKREIQEGEELFISYGEDYWSGLKITPIPLLDPTYFKNLKS